MKNRDFTMETDWFEFKEKLLSRDFDAWNEFSKICERIVIKIVRDISIFSPNDARDIVQEFLAAKILPPGLNWLNSYNPERGNMINYVFLPLRWFCYSMAKKTNQENLADLDINLVKENATDIDAVESRELLRKIVELNNLLIGCISETKKENMIKKLTAFNLYIYGIKHREIAARLGCETKNIGSMIRSAVSLYKKAIAQHPEFNELICFID